jgi:uncharacterized Zn-binding protein involved in type VI secretion
MPTPGRIASGAGKVFASGRPVARAGDEGHSPFCCAGIGKILIQSSQTKVFVEGVPAAAVGTTTVHCAMSPGTIRSGDTKVFVP